MSRAKSTGLPMSAVESFPASNPALYQESPKKEILTTDTRFEAEFRGSFPLATTPTRLDSGVSLVIPAYNEEFRIRRALDSYLPILEKCGRPFEVIVVADGTDRTPEVVREYANRSVRSFEFKLKLGKGGALLRGFELSRFDTIGYVDADGSLAPADLNTLIAESSKFDCVIGSRYLKGSRWVVKEPSVKRFASRGFNVLVRGLLGIPVRDSQCGAKFYRGDLLRQIVKEVTVTNLTIDVGVLYHVRKAGGRIREVPVVWSDHRDTKFRLEKMIAYMFVTLVGIRLMNLGTARVIPKGLVDFFQRTMGST